jgi:hypothetical protein
VDRTATRILKALRKRGEVSVYDAVRLARSRHRNHVDQYPLAVLLDEGYVGMSISLAPIPHMDPVLSLAVGLHIWRLRKKAEPVEYLGITSTGGFDTRNERMFLKAKGLLYLDARQEKRQDRMYAVLLAVFAAAVTAALTAFFTVNARLLGFG